MATQFSILAWEIPWTAESGGLQFTDHKESDTPEQQHTLRHRMPTEEKYLVDDNNSPL